MAQPFNIATTNITDLIMSAIHEAYIVDYGIISKIYEEDLELVQVHVGACTSIDDFASFPCILGSFCSANMNVKVKANVGDRVIVLYPRRFSAKMFDPDKQVTYAKADNMGYMYGKGIAFLAAQFVTDNEVINKNLLHVTDEGITFTSDKQLDTTMGKAPVEGEENTNKAVTLNINGTTIGIDVDGNISMSSNKDKAITINGAKFTVKDGDVDIAAKDKAITVNGAKFTVSNGTVNIEATKVTINGTSLEVS